jgi:ABC-type ATPase involved in cell division
LALISEFLELGIRPGDYLGSGYSLLYEDSRKFLFETKISNKEISTIRNITIDFIKKRKGLIFDKSKLYELKNFVSDILIDKKNYYNWL